MVRLALRAEEKRSEVVYCLLRPRERRVLERAMHDRVDETTAEHNVERRPGRRVDRATTSRGSILREAFLKVYHEEIAAELAIEQHSNRKATPKE